MAVEIPGMRRIYQILAGSVTLTLLGIIACSGSAIESNPAPSRTAKASPTPNIAETVEAVVTATTEALPAPATHPIPTPLPDAVIELAPDIAATVQAAVQIAIAGLPAPTPIPTPAAAPTSIPTPFPTKVLISTATPQPTSTPIPTLKPTAPVEPTPSSPLPEDLRSMVEQVKRGIVRIETTSVKFSERGTGSGVIFEKEANWGAAFILTNYHVIENVIADLDPIISVTVNDSTSYMATVVGVDIKRDLAILKICCQRFTPLPFGDAENVKIGDPVVAVGYALGIAGEATATRGIVSGVRFVTDDDRWVVQTDAPINPGNSGGPLLSLAGEVLGINTYKFAGFFIEGIGFAVAENTVQEQLQKLKAGGDALDAVNVLAKWTFGPTKSYETMDIRVDKFPWVFEWTLEE